MGFKTALLLDYETSLDNPKLVKEAYRTLIDIAAIDRDDTNRERLDQLEEKAEERLFRRLDNLCTN